MRRISAWVALVSLCGVVPYHASAEIELVPPVGLNDKVDDVRDAVANPNADPTDLRFRAETLFGQAQRTHHLPVEGLGLWQKAAGLGAPGQDEATVQDMVDHFRGLLVREPPAPLADKDPEAHGRLIEDYLAFEQLAQAGAVLKDEKGELPASAAAAYVWNIAKSAKDGTIDGSIIGQRWLFAASKQLGEFILATFGAHEPRHRRSHQRDAAGLADEVKDAEIEAFLDEGRLMTLMDPTGYKFARLWINTIERSGTDEIVGQYVRHLAEIRHAYSEGRDAVRKLVESRGYQDRPGLFNFHQHAHRGPDGNHAG